MIFFKTFHKNYVSLFARNSSNSEVFKNAAGLRAGQAEPDAHEYSCKVEAEVTCGEVLESSRSLPVY